MSQYNASVTVRKRFDHPRADVFEAFANREHLASWLSPSSDIQMNVVHHQFEIDGIFEYCFDEGNGESNSVSGTFEKISIPDQLVFSWIWAAPHRFAHIKTQVNVHFFERDAQTEIVITHNKLANQEACDMHAMGWTGALEHLAEQLPQFQQP